MFTSANIGGLDRAIRLVAALVLAAYAWMHPGATLAVVAWVVAAILALTAIVRFCPAYRILGISSCPVNRLP